MSYSEISVLKTKAETALWLLVKLKKQAKNIHKNGIKIALQCFRFHANISGFKVKIRTKLSLEEKIMNTF